ncbi:MAG: Asp23/Gls24 family envelope stress response protein [Oscillospiraceae bacterium]|jgi:uncharacterized alkaline shock family protein YloU
MVEIKNEAGHVYLTPGFFSDLVGQTATKCFGVSGMADGNTWQSIRSLLSHKEYIDKGVQVTVSNGKLNIELHIKISYGLNIGETVRAITHNVKYVVEEVTGIPVAQIRVYVDEITSEPEQENA